MTNAPDEPPAPDERAASGAPIALKVALCVQGFFYFAVSGIQGPATADTAVRFAVLGVCFLALVGLWRLRRWGLWLAAAVLAFYLVTHVAFVPIAWRGLVLGTLVRTIGIVAGVVCWRRLRA